MCVCSQTLSSSVVFQGTSSLGVGLFGRFGLFVVVVAGRLERSEGLGGLVGGGVRGGVVAGLEGGHLLLGGDEGLLELCRILRVAESDREDFLDELAWAAKGCFNVTSTRVFRDHFCQNKHSPYETLRRDDHSSQDMSSETE